VRLPDDTKVGVVEEHVFLHRGEQILEVVDSVVQRVQTANGRHPSAYGQDKYVETEGSRDHTEDIQCVHG
jgi:hypothetical protein